RTARSKNSRTSSSSSAITICGMGSLSYCLLSLTGPSPTGGRETATIDRKNLPGVGRREYLDPCDPFDPLEAATAGRNQPCGRAVAVRERFCTNMGGEQRRPSLIYGKAPAIAGNRDEAHPVRIRRDTSSIQYPADQRATPALGGVEAACAVQGRLDLILAREQVGIDERQRTRDSAADIQPPGGRIDRARLIGDPARRRKCVPGIAA